jgi:opacity protein-like surface antigen
MRTPRSAAVALAAAVSLAPQAAHSQTAIGIRGFGGYNTYAMGDAEDIRHGLQVPASQFPPLKDGYSLGVGAEWAWRQSLSFAVSYERIAVGRMSEIKIYDTGGNLITSQKMQLPCNALLLETEYRRRLKPRILFGAGGGAGYYQLGEEVESPATGQDFEGDSFGGQAFAIGEWEMTPAASVGLDIGYRWAKLGVDKVNRQPPPHDIDMDYSGLNTRIVLRYLPRRTR